MRYAPSPYFMGAVYALAIFGAAMLVLLVLG
jgi:hypothetical protein